MTVETATYISDFDPTLPTSTDLRSEGDNHIRLEKQVLKNTFPNATRAFYFPTNFIVQATNFAIAATDGGKLFLVTANAAKTTITLPALTAADAGWMVSIVPSGGTFPIIVSGGASFIQRPCLAGITNVRCKVINFEYIFRWSGSGWFANRPVGLPIGSMIDFAGSVLPAGYEWPNGQVLASVAADYPDYNAAMGGGATLDMRGRVGITLDNLGGAAAGRVGTIITGTAVGNTGGSETVALGTANIPNLTSTNSGAIAISTAPAVGGNVPSITGGQTWVLS